MDDPIESEQLEVLQSLLQDEISEPAITGFLIVSSRFVDEYGGHRTAELRNIFRTDLPEGKRSLRMSLEYLQSVFGSFSEFEANYPVTIIPAAPVFPMFKIVGIQTFISEVYRVFDSEALVYNTNENVVEYISTRGHLPPVPRLYSPVLRRKPPAVHWCAYDKWDSPEETREGLQILPEWSNCKLRVSVPTSAIQEDSYVAYNGNNSGAGFDGYFYEPLTQDQPKLRGGHVQIAVFGEPKVRIAELWDESSSSWETIKSDVLGSSTY